MAANMTIALPIIGFVFGIYAAIHYVRTGFTDPGFIPRAEPEEAMHFETQNRNCDVLVFKKERQCVNKSSAFVLHRNVRGHGRRILSGTQEQDGRHKRRRIRDQVLRKLEIFLSSLSSHFL